MFFVNTQMGNLDRPPFLSLHVYACGQPRELITGQARLFDLDVGEIQYTDGGSSTPCQRNVSCGGAWAWWRPKIW